MIMDDKMKSIERLKGLNCPKIVQNCIKFIEKAANNIIKVALQGNQVRQQERIM